MVDKDFSYGSSSLELVLSSRGGVVTVLGHGRGYGLPSSELGLLVFRVGGEEFQLGSQDFGRCECHEDGVCFVNHPLAPGLCFAWKIRSEGARLLLRPVITGIPSGWRLERIVFMPVTVSGVGNVLIPYSEGMLCRQAPAGHGFGLDTPEPTRYFRYPGRLQMQFIAYCHPQGGGIYLGAEDPSHAPKDLFFRGQEQWQLVMSLYVCSTGDSYRSQTEFALAAFEGDWRGAADLYRDYVYREGRLTRREAPWIGASPVVVTYLVRGEGAMSDATNQFVPFVNALQPLERVAEKTDSKVLAFPLRADGHGPWLPPYVWPPVGGEEGFRKFVQAMHAHGHYVGFYGSGLSFTTRSQTNDYTGELQELEGEVARNADGSTIDTGIQGVRESVHLCPAQPAVQELMLEQARAVAAAGVDFFQLFDQNFGGTHCRSCYDPHHRHPAAPDAWETEAWAGLFDKLLKEIGSMVLGTECAAAHPFVNQLCFNDLRPQFAWGCRSSVGEGHPVPLYGYVFHEFVNNFSGNQCMWDDFDAEASPENLLWRTAYGFNAGDLLTFPMKKNGEADWGAAAPWSMPGPEEKHILTLIRNLNRCRKEQPEFLRYGRMVRLTHEVSGDNLVMKRYDGPFETKAFFANQWEAKDGRQALILTNFLPQEQRVTVDGKAVTLPPLEAVVLQA